MSTFAGACGPRVVASHQPTCASMCVSVAPRPAADMSVELSAAGAVLHAHSFGRPADCHHAARDSVQVVVCGEVFDWGRLLPAGLLHDTQPNPASRIAETYLGDKECQFLPELDGEFVIFIHDTERGLFRVACDRLGIRHVYWLEDASTSWFASSVAAFADAAAISIKPDALAARELLEVGHLLENRTHVAGCTLLPAATCRTVETLTGKYTDHQYWTPNSILPRTPSSCRVDEAALELGDLLSDAVGRRLADCDSATVTLSGGLDSRALLAAACESGTSLTAVTFGRRGALDIRIAAAAARRAGVPHAVVTIDERNWLQPRVRGTWITAGEFPLQHMHGIEARAELQSRAAVNLNGFIGDLVAGGQWLSAYRLDGPVNEALARHLTGASAEVLAASVLAHANDAKSDFYVLCNRVRRFTANGPFLLDGWTRDRKPFIARRLLEFLYSLPDSMRLSSSLYRQALCRRYPELFTTIPWQKTGVPVCWPPLTWKLARRAQAAKGRLMRLAGGSGRLDYSDYAAWMRASPSREVIERVLLAHDALYGQLIDPRPAASAWHCLLAGKDTSETLGRCLTLELWLQQAFNRRWRDWQSLAVDCGLAPTN